MRSIAVAVVVLGGCGGPPLHLAGGGGVAQASERGWVGSIDLTIDRPRDDGLVLGQEVAVEYVATPVGSVLGLPAGACAGVRHGAVRATVGGGAALLAIGRVTHHLGIGVAPYAGAALRFGGDTTVTLDGRVRREVLLSSPDITVWSAVVLVGQTFR